MASDTRVSSNGFLYFIVGALLVAVGVLAFMSYNDNLGQTPEEAAIERSADAIGDAARGIEDTVSDAARDAQRNAPPPPPAPLTEPATAPNP
jgi:hypothetical protein